jgi:hypothetical protein
MRLSLYIPGLDGKLVVLNAADGALNGVCYVGRLEDKEAMRLVLPEDACEAVCRAIKSVVPNDVHENAREALRKLQADNALLLTLERGIPLPSPSQTEYREISVPELQHGSSSAEGRLLGLIARNKSMDEAKLTSKQAYRAGFVIATWDDNESGLSAAPD